MIAGVSRSAYYKWSTGKAQPAFDDEDYLAIKAVFDDKKALFGVRRIAMELARKGNPMSPGKICRIMQKHGLKTKVRAASPYKDAPKATEVMAAENVLNRQFIQSTVRRFFCTDITYIHWNGTFIYLSTIKDIASGEIIAWECSLHIDMQLVLDTIAHFERNMLTAIWSLKGSIMHSDRGTHYTGPQWRGVMERLGMIRSMSRVGRCIDNAPMESFFGHFKDEVSVLDCHTFDAVSLRVEQYMQYYNNHRPQWEKKKMTPVEYRNHLLA